jgi:hypothetical protein
LALSMAQFLLTIGLTGTDSEDSRKLTPSQQPYAATRLVKVERAYRKQITLSRKNIS